MRYPFRLLFALSLALCCSFSPPAFAADLTSGGNHSGFVSGLMDIDSWTFAAEPGDSVELRLGGTVTMYLELFAPNGVRVETSVGSDAGFLHAVNQSGTYIAVVSTYIANQSGSYSLRYARMPAPFVVPAGDEGGALTNGGNHAGSIPVGDLDLWTIQAYGGDTLRLRLNGSAPTYLQLFRPDGTRVETSSGSDAAVDHAVVSSGTYTVLVSASNWGGSPTYTLRAARVSAPFIVPAGDEGGVLTNGASHAGSIPVGDLDLWTIEAHGGDTLYLRLGAGAAMALELFAPDGTRVETSSGTDAAVFHVAASSGTYTALVGANSWGGNGTYNLHAARLPAPFVVPAGDDGGTLTNGGNHPGSIPVGDVDLWTIEAHGGDTLYLRLGASASMFLQLFGPDGARVETSGGTDAAVSHVAAVSGTYTALISANNWSGSGTYTLRAARVAAPFVVPAGDEGGALTSGADHAGSIPVGDVDPWTIEARGGDTLYLRLGGSAAMSLQLFAPDGTRVELSGGTDAAVSHVVASPGTYTALVTANNWGGAGTYALRAARMSAPFVVPPSDEGGPLADGSTAAGSLAVGDVDLFSFPATAGDTLQFTSTGSTARYTLFGPDGTQLATSGGTNAAITTTALDSGLFTLLVTPHNWGGAGPYTVTFLRTEIPVVPPVGTWQGTLDNGANHTGALASHLEVERWTFDAQPGDTLRVRAAGTLDVNLELFGPDGARVAFRAGDDVAVGHRATQAGTHTVQVSGRYTNYSGSYTLRLARLPASFSVPAGDEGGALTRGGNHPGTLGKGDLDLWTFDAAVGDNLRLRLGATIDADLELFAPDGSRVTWSWDDDVAISHRVTVAGTYTVLVGAHYAAYSGSYTLRLAQLPQDFGIPAGDEGGALTAGANHAGTITKGDLDLWTFDAIAGDNIRLRIGSTIDVNLELFGPDGSRVARSWDDDVTVSHRVTQPGTYTVLVSAHYAAYTGTYTLRLAQLPQVFVVPPGDEGGALTAGANHPGEIAKGDLDPWTFDAIPGDNIRLRVGATLDVNLQLFGPDGSRVTWSWGDDVAVSHRVTQAGTYTVLVSAHYAAYTGTYTLRLLRMPQSFVVPEGDEGGALGSGLGASAAIAKGDLDAWSFGAAAGDRLRLRLGATGFARFELYDPSGARVTWTWGSDLSLQHTATLAGTYTVVVSAYYAAYTGTYWLYGANLADPYLDWLHTYFPTTVGRPADEATQWGSHADADADNAANWFEYHFGTRPTIGRASPPLTVGVEGAFLVGEFRRLAGASEISTVAQWSNDLLVWSTVGLTYDPPVADGAYEVVRVRVPLGSAPRKFLRLVVSRPD